ncbi:MAG: phytoene/squalene synthase family protein [Fimbriimonadaceae bacterium]|nr:phytoene/squalene synthase family protein [Fimbriimonadaceae bacterium]
MAGQLTSSYARCREIVKAASSSFGLGMKLFPPAQRDGIFAMYAFFRITDDLVDEPGQEPAKRAAFEIWRTTVQRALSGGSIEFGSPLLAIAETARRYQLPTALFERCLDACGGDLGPVRCADWPALRRYCDGVAGTVGEACLRILGYCDPALLALSQANARGVQLTNILRDVSEDLQLDRIYLPADLLAQHHLTTGDLSGPRLPAVRALLAAVGAEAQREYERADSLFYMLRPADRPGIVAMTVKYRSLLARLRATDYAVSGRLAAAPGPQILWAAVASRWAPAWRAS